MINIFKLSKIIEDHGKNYLDIGHYYSKDTKNCNYMYIINDGRFLFKPQVFKEETHNDVDIWKYERFNTYGRVDKCMKNASINQFSYVAPDSKKSLFVLRKEIMIAEEKIKKIFGNDIKIYRFH